jgi:hypothetical protein
MERSETKATREDEEGSRIGARQIGNASVTGSCGCAHLAGSVDQSQANLSQRSTGGVSHRDAERLRIDVRARNRECRECQ